MMAAEQTYIIPLRKEFQKAPKYKRAKKAVNAVREYVQKHMKTDDVLIGPKLNLKIWEHGIKNPPHHVKVTAVMDDKEGVARVELFGFEFKKKEKKEAKKKAKGIAGKLQEKLEATKKEPPKDIKSEKKELKKAEKAAAQADKKEKPAEEKPAEPKPEEKKEEVKVEEKSEEKAEEKPAEAKPEQETKA